MAGKFLFSLLNSTFSILFQERMFAMVFLDTNEELRMES